jgi:hypothetical protein
MTSTTTTRSHGPMASLAHWAADTYPSPQDAVGSAAYHMIGAEPYAMAWYTSPIAWPTDDPDAHLVKGGDFTAYADVASEGPTVEAMVLGHSYSMARYL